MLAYSNLVPLGWTINQHQVKISDGTFGTIYCSFIYKVAFPFTKVRNLEIRPKCICHLKITVQNVLSVGHSSLTDQALPLQEGVIKALEFMKVIADAEEVKANTDYDA